MIFVIVGDGKHIQGTDALLDKIGPRLPPVVALCPQSIINRVLLSAVSREHAPCSISKICSLMLGATHKAFSAGAIC
jgi:hypothetical protein